MNPGARSQEDMIMIRASWLASGSSLLCMPTRHCGAEPSRAEPSRAEPSRAAWCRAARSVHDIAAESSHTANGPDLPSTSQVLYLPVPIVALQSFQWTMILQAPAPAPAPAALGSRLPADPLLLRRSHGTSGAGPGPGPGPRPGTRLNTNSCWQSR